MKKILVVLLILAVAGGVFAQQGEWSLGGNLVIGTRLDFDPNPEQDSDDPALVDGIGYFDWDNIRGQLQLGYNRDNINIGMELSTAKDATFKLNFNGDAFRGQMSIKNLLAFLGGNDAAGYYGADVIAQMDENGDPLVDDDGNPIYVSASAGSLYGSGTSLDRLWGEFKFFDGIITLVPAFNSEEIEYWISDKTGTFTNKVNPWKTIGNGRSPYGGGDSFTKVDHNNYLLAGAEISALNFGVMIPNLFAPWNGAWASWGKETGNADSTKFVDGTLKKMILGLSFNQSPFEFAAQFALANYGIYFGGKFYAGPITVGLSAQAILDGDSLPAPAPQADNQHVKIGGDVSYNGDGFGGGLSGFYEKEDFVPRDADGNPTGPSEWYLSTIGVEPYFYYAAIPSHLMFRLDVGFYFFNDTNGTADNKATVWALQPQLFWNFLGTGATDSWWGGFNTGIIIRYRLANADTRDMPRFGGGTKNNSVNFADIIFKWSF